MRNLQTCKIPRKDKNVLVKNALFGHITCSTKEYNYVKYSGIRNPVCLRLLSFDLFSRGSSSSWPNIRSEPNKLLMFSFRFPFVILRGLCLVKFAGSAGNPDSSGEFAGKPKIKITYLGLSDRNVFLVLQ